MNLNNIQDLLISSIKENQKLNGVFDLEVKLETIPVGDLDRFDSLTSAEVLIDLESKIEKMFNRKVNLELSNFFIRQRMQSSPKLLPYQSLSVTEIAKNIYDLINR